MRKGVFHAAALLSLLFLTFVAGAWATWYDHVPFLKHAFIGGEALWKALIVPEDPENTDVWWRPGPEEGPMGVSVLDERRVFAGPTLITVGQSARLIDHHGAVLHEWRLPYDRFIDPKSLVRVPPDSWLFWNPARVLPNGDLVALVDLMHTTPQGLGLVRLDSRSKVVWARQGHFHHDFDIGPDGRIYALDQLLSLAEMPDLPALQPPLIDEGITVMSPDGEVLSRVSLINAFRRSPYRVLLDSLAQTNRTRWGDYLHSNNVDVVTAEAAAHMPFLKAGQILVSFRELSTIAALDLETKSIVWAQTGQWRNQHDPDPLPNGNIILFDNRGDWERGGQSRVIEFNPITRAVTWRFPALPGQTLSSGYRARQQKLPNGNVLINEFERSRLLEVAPDGEIVWQYRCPFRYGTDEGRVCRVMSARRYARSDLAFLATGAGKTAAAAVPRARSPSP